jgi:hypothetical protein
VGLRRYLDWALISGVIMFGAFALLVEGVHLAVLASGAVAAVLAMAVNGLVNRAVVARRPSVWASVAVDQGVQASLARLAADVGADRAYVLPPRADASAALPPGLLVYAISRRHPMVITEAASHRVQRRTNIEVASRMILPVVDRRGGLAGVVAVVVCERYATRGFDATALETATRAVAELVPVLAAARVEMPIRAEPQMARSAPGTS